MSYGCHSNLKVKQWHCIIVALILYIIIGFFDSRIFPIINDKEISIEPEIINNNVDNNINNNQYITSHIPIYGEDKYCDPISKKSFGYIYKTAVIMGLYNTGTNALIELLMKNCWGMHTTRWMYSDLYKYEEFKEIILPEIDNFLRWKYTSSFNITKHQPSASLEYLNEHNISKNKFEHEQLNVVLIKDPLFWFKSICKQPYYIFFIYEQEWLWNKLCPYGIYKINGTISANEWHTFLYKSIIELYNKYYESWMGSIQTPPIGGTPYVINKWREMYNNYAQQKFKTFNISLEKKNKRLIITKTIYQYMINNNFKSNNNNLFEQEIMNKTRKMRKNGNFPTVVVRFEDLLFNPQQIVDRLCKCVGGYRRNDTKLRQTANKPHGNSRNRSEAVTYYSNITNRYQNYHKNDIIFLKNNLNQTILDFFNYDISTNFTQSFKVINEEKPSRFYHRY